MGETVACTAVSPHMHTLSYIQQFPHTCSHCHTYSSFPTPVLTVIHTAVFPHLYTLSSIQPFPHTCTYCHLYSHFPTLVHTVIHTDVSQHLYTLSDIQVQFYPQLRQRHSDWGNFSNGVCHIMKITTAQRSPDMGP